MKNHDDQHLSDWIADLDAGLKDVQTRLARVEMRDARLAAWIAERAKLAKARKGRDFN